MSVRAFPRWMIEMLIEFRLIIEDCRRADSAPRPIPFSHVATLSISLARRSAQVFLPSLLHASRRGMTRRDVLPWRGCSATFISGLTLKQRRSCSLSLLLAFLFLFLFADIQVKSMSSSWRRAADRLVQKSRGLCFFTYSG